jgi:hypothetical protein
MQLYRTTQLSFLGIRRVEDLDSAEIAKLEEREAILAN